MKTGIVRFPGSNCDEDVFHVFSSLLHQDVFYLWHEESSLRGADLVVLPGGFAHGDYLRAGAMAKISPVISSIKTFADQGGLVLGICNGFQVLTEIGLLPGALTRNLEQKFVCDWVYLRVENPDIAFTRAYRKGEIVRFPVAHGEGRFWIDAPGLEELNRNHQVVFRYCNAQGEITAESNPNGSVDSIAGVCNKAGNAMGLMPHPERACEAVLGGEDGRRLFQSVLKILK